jgi:hypothetical protein
MNDIDIGWTAGIIDGEGSIFAADKWSIRVRVGSTDMRIITKLIDLWSGITGINRKAQAKQKVCYYWQLSGTNAAPLLKAVRPHLVIKQEQAALALLFIDTVGSPGRELHALDKQTRYECIEQLAVLNRRGV